MLETALFGYQKGASNGADGDERGLMETANCGTLLFDEIGHMPTYLQSRVSRALQDHKLCQPGDEVEIKLNFRLIRNNKPKRNRVV